MRNARGLQSNGASAIRNDNIINDVVQAANCGIEALSMYKFNTRKAEIIPAFLLFYNELLWYSMANNCDRQLLTRVYGIISMRINNTTYAQFSTIHMCGITIDISLIINKLRPVLLHFNTRKKRSFFWPCVIISVHFLPLIITNNIMKNNSFFFFFALSLLLHYYY